MIQRRLLTGASLVAGAVAVVVMAVWGLHALTAPFGDSANASGGPTCTANQPTSTVVRRSEVTVSVYNTGKRKGRAGATLAMFEAAGFQAGAVGNGTPGDHVRRAEVRTTKAGDPAAKLVALALGKGTKIVVTDQDVGPGVDVFIGDRFGGLDPAAPHTVTSVNANSGC